MTGFPGQLKHQAIGKPESRLCAEQFQRPIHGLAEIPRAHPYTLPSTHVASAGAVSTARITLSGIPSYAVSQFVYTPRFRCVRPEQRLTDFLGTEPARAPDDNPAAFLFPFQD